MSGAVSLLLAETMSAIHGNESFQARVEYSTVAHLYLGDKPHLIMQVLLYLALQSVNISSIIISEQVRIRIRELSITNHCVELTWCTLDNGLFTHPAVSQNMWTQLHPRLGLW
jgi:hypothetical protein